MRAFMLQLSEAEHASFLAMSPGSMPLASIVRILPEVELASGLRPRVFGEVAAEMLVN